MAIFGIGAYYYGTTDVSNDFLTNNIVGTGWDVNAAPELHRYFKSLKVGDIIYIKAAFGPAKYISVKGIGIISDNEILDTSHHHLTEIGRNVKWVKKTQFKLPKPVEKNNVRSNTVYEEFHPNIQEEIIKRI
ncbi:hypothetical protein AB9K26_00620 [Psychroserpens sp. XS_ASV72]|uniref:hypothetical protein n=1 Tax=Psychroserpens sp. XS_ASV72 TaxID=3241293 RepID=UPI00351582B1